MQNIEWKRLKSGTDIRGVAMDGVENQPLDLTDPVVERIAAGFALFLSERARKPGSGLTISVGRDSRLSGPRIRAAVVRALTAAGVHVLDCGLASTPAMFMTTVDAGCDGAVQITASHHPWHRNGLKFFTPAGGLEGRDIETILEYAQNGMQLRPAKRVCEEVDYMSR